MGIFKNSLNNHSLFLIVRGYCTLYKLSVRLYTAPRFLNAVGLNTLKIWPARTGVFPSPTRTGTMTPPRLRRRPTGSARRCCRRTSACCRRARSRAPSSTSSTTTPETSSTSARYGFGCRCFPSFGFPTAMAESRLFFLCLFLLRLFVCLFV